MTINTTITISRLPACLEICHLTEEQEHLKIITIIIVNEHTKKLKTNIIYHHHISHFSASSHTGAHCSSTADRMCLVGWVSENLRLLTALCAGLVLISLMNQPLMFSLFSTTLWFSFPELPLIVFFFPVLFMRLLTRI